MTMTASDQFNWSYVPAHGASNKGQQMIQIRPTLLHCDHTHHLILSPKKCANEMPTQLSMNALGTLLVMLKFGFSTNWKVVHA
jgi:hypothetical protein